MSSHVPSPTRQTPRAVGSLLLRRRFSPASRRRAEQDWVFFLLEELNGLGDILRFQQEPEGHDARAADVLARAGSIIDALGWQPDAALAHTWAFASRELQFQEDAWGPNLVLERLEPDRRRLHAWRATLSAEARAILSRTPSPPSPPPSEDPQRRTQCAHE
jgi:hypothetical protein